ncbi:MAG: hypothetical protein U1E22_10340 [Coriobacteriia bacterium]|nr:hypothetical protein [Coriobacteriia bacterium]
MGSTIGAAADFYRLRVTRLDDSGALDLEWRDDILYREPPRQTVPESEVWRIEAVNVDDEDDVRLVAMYEDAEGAHDALETLQEELETLTKSQFEEAFLAAE